MTTAGAARRPAAWLGMAIVAAGLANGAGAYLRRVGFVERASYERFWELHTGPEGFTRAPFGLGRRCVRHRSIAEGGAEPAGGGPPARYVHAVRRWEAPLKGLKDAVVLALVAGGLVAWRRAGGAGPPGAPPGRWARAALLLGLAAIVSAHAAAGLARGALLETATGLRAFGFVAVALAAAPIAGDLLRRLVPWLVGLVAVQAALAPIELLRGVPIQGHGWLFGEYFARRAAGSLVMPNTLGILAAAVVALATGYGATARVRAAAWGFGGIAVVLSGSATGLVMLAAAGAVGALAAPRRSGARRLAGLGAALAAASFALYVVRPDVLDSFTARVSGLKPLAAAPAGELLFGREIGAGTISATTLRRGFDREGRLGTKADAPPAPGGDTAVGTLVLQTGFVGLVLFYAALAAAWARCARARPLVLALAAATLTLGVTEAFPVNVLLGLALGSALGRSTPGSGLPSTLYVPTERRV